MMQEAVRSQMARFQSTQTAPHYSSGELMAVLSATLVICLFGTGIRLPPSPSPASFLFDDTFCQNVMDKHVVLHFAPTYDGGKWQKRAAKTNLPSRFRGQQGDAGPNEVSVTWTNNQNTATLDCNVYLTPIHGIRSIMPIMPYL